RWPARWWWWARWSGWGCGGVDAACRYHRRSQRICAMTEALTPPPEPAEPAADPRADTLEALEGALDALREHHPQRVPQWKYCEGVLTALLCMRRTVPPTEWLPLLFDGDDVFASEGERTQFMMHWLAREAQLRAQLQAPVEALDDEQALEPGVIDWRGLLASLPEDERA